MRIIDIDNDFVSTNFVAGTAALQDRIAAIERLQELEEEESDEASA